jgi:integrase
MRGATVKRGKTWSAVYDETTPDGKRKQRWKGGFPTQKEAQAYLHSVLPKIGDGTYVAPSELTLGQYLVDEWLPAIAGTIRPLSLTSYTSVIKHRIVPRIGHLRLQGLSGGHLNAFYAELEKAGLSVASRRLTHAVISRALRDAVRWEKTTRNAADAADPPATAETRATAWTAGELSRFLGHVEADRWFPIWRLAAMTGMRRGELLGLTWFALDLENASLRVDQQLVPTRGGLSFGPPKSKRSRRTIALDQETVEILKRHREAQLLERQLAGETYADADLVFATEAGTPINPTRLTEWFLARRKAAGILTGTLHILRHTCATLALTEGIPLHVVAARLGDRPETILRAYAHLLPSSDVEAAERVAALVSSR